MTVANPEVLPARNDKQRARSRKRRIARLLLAALVAWWVVGFVGAFVATSARPYKMPTTARIGGIEVEDVSCRARDGVQLRGWLASPAKPTKRAVVIAAGIGGNRLAIRSRARPYLDRGIATLLVDLRGTGESEATRISMGWHEALDLLAWRELLFERGFPSVGAHGVSLGAAAAVFTSMRDESDARWDYLVLEACYSSLAEAFAARVTPLPLFLFWPMVVCSECMVSLDMHELDAVAAIARHDCPALFVCGTADRKVGPHATQRLFDASPATIKQRHDVPGVGHRDLWMHDGGSVRRALDAFLQRVGR